MKKGKKIRSNLALLVICSMMLPSVATANYTSGFEHLGKGTNYGEPVWKTSNTFKNEGIAYSSNHVGSMLLDVQSQDVANLQANVNDLPWLDELLVNEGIIPDDQANSPYVNTLFSRGSGLFLKSQESSKLGFVGEVCYADTLNQNTMFSVDLSGQTLTENTSLRKNYPSHENQTWTSSTLKVNQRKFITNGNTAVALLDITNTSNAAVTFDITVSSPFTSTTNGNELYGENVAAPLMVGTGNLSDYVKAMSYVDVHLNGNNMQISGNKLLRSVTIPAKGSIAQKVVMGWVAEEIPTSQTDYDTYTAVSDNNAAYIQHVTAYNDWWSEYIPYIDIPDDNVKKVLYYRWWCNRYNLLAANIPGNDWQFPMNMEGITGYNNGITVSVAWAMQDLKWLRNPEYVYGTWLSQGEYSKNSNYKNNPGRPNTWTWDMMQSISAIGWEAYKIHGGGSEILSKFANMSRDDVIGTLNTFSVANTSYDNDNLVFYNHGPITGNDGDTVSMNYNGGGTFARVDGSSTNYANAVATAKMYEALGDTSAAATMNTKANSIRAAILSDLWYDKSDFDGDGKADTKGVGSFLHRQVSTGKMNPWRDNNLFAFSFGVVPTAKEAGYNSKYLTQLYDYGDPNYYPIFPFFTADQTSIEKRIAAWIAGTANAYGTNQFAFCNFGNYINIVRESLRSYPVNNINVSTYQTLFDWGAWLHTVEEGNTDHLDANEFFWLEDYFFGTQWTKTNPPKSSGNMVRSWIHHDTLGMMDYTVIEDMAGLMPREDNIIELWPLGVDYDHFAVDNISYHGKDLSIVWQNPSKPVKYSGIPTGYSLYMDGVRMFTVDSSVHLTFDPSTGRVTFPAGDIQGAVGNNSKAKVIYQIGTVTPFNTANNTSLTGDVKIVDMFNKAGVDLVNNGVNLARATGTTVTATGVNAASSINNLKNGDTAVTDRASDNLASNFTSFKGSANATDSVTFDFGSSKVIDNVKLYFYNDRLINGYMAPANYELLYMDASNSWKPINKVLKTPTQVGENYNNAVFEPVSSRYLKVNITHKSGFSTGITELAVFNNNLNLSIVNTPPTINMPANAIINFGDILNIIPTIMDDGLPNRECTYTWSVISKPSTSATVNIQSPNARKLQATFDTVGTYVLELAANDGAIISKKNITVNVAVSAATVKAIIKKYSNTSYLTINSADYTTASWNALQQSIASANTVLNSGNYTDNDIANMAIGLTAAVDNLKYVNIALLAETTTNYSSSWEKLSAVNDGYIPLGATKDEAKGDYAYGNWGGTPTEYYVEYTWKSPATISSASTYFYNDGGGIGLPGSYSYKYYDGASGNFVNVANPSVYTLNNGNFNTVTFNSVTTTKFRIYMTKASTTAWNGIKEFRVMGSLAATKEIASIMPASAETIVNVQPIMPTTVVVTYKDGTTGTVAVTWNAISPNNLSTATNFTVAGTVTGTTMTATCNVYVKYDKSGLNAVITQAGAKTRTAYPNATQAQWDSFTAAYQAAINCYQNTSATEGEISTATNNLTQAITILDGTNGTINITNIATLATATSTYTSSWNSVSAVKDGLVTPNNKSNVTPDGNQTSVYGNWGSGASQSVTLTWSSPKTVTSASILFYDNREGDAAYTGQGLDVWEGVGAPLSYTYEYLNSNGIWTAIPTSSGLTNNVDVFNTANFVNPIQTTAIRITMNRNNLGTGIIEWRVMGY